MAKISLFIQLLESFTKQFIKDVGRAPKTRNELMSIQDDVVRYLNKKKGVPEGPKKPPFQGFTPEVIQGGKSKEGIKSIPVDEQFTTKKINQIDDELDNLSTGEGKYGKMNRNDRENEMIRLQDESSTLQETFNVKSPLVQDDALRIKQGLSTRIKLNSENENAQMVKDLILRKNKEFNSLDRTQQKEILDRIQNQIKESKAKSATNVNPDDEMPFASGGLARVGYADGSYKSEGLFGIPMEDIRKYKKKKRMDRTPPFAIPDDWLEKFLKRFEKTGTYEQPMASGGLARVGYAGGKIVKGAPWVINKLKEQLFDMDLGIGGSTFSKLTSTQKDFYKKELNTLIKQLEQGGEIPKEMLDTMIADPKFKSVVKTRSTDKDLYDLEDALLDHQAGKQADQIVDDVFGPFDADGKLNKKRQMTADELARS